MLYIGDRVWYNFNELAFAAWFLLRGRGGGGKHFRKMERLGKKPCPFCKKAAGSEGFSARDAFLIIRERWALPFRAAPSVHTDGSERPAADPPVVLAPISNLSPHTDESERPFPCCPADKGAAYAESGGERGCRRKRKCECPCLPSVGQREPSVQRRRPPR